MNHPHTPDREFHYRAPFIGLVAGSIFAGIVGYFTANHAATNDRGLVLNHLIELSRENATLFWWVTAWIFIGFVPMAVGLLLLRVLNPQRLALSRDGLYACKWPWSQPALIPYASIRRIATTKTRHYTIAKIFHPRGSHSVAAAWMPSEEDFHDFCAQLIDRIEASRSAPSEECAMLQA